jgi:membrane associated rhomboid family serine protease
MVAVLIGAFGAQWLLELIEKDRVISPNWLMGWLSLDRASAANGEWWKFFTFGFLHVNIFHLAANMLLLYFAGCETEPILGRRHILGLFVGGTLIGGAFHCVAMPESPLVGVSAGVAAVVAAYATTLPELEVVGHLLFVVPLKVRAKFFGIAVAVIGAACWTANFQPTIGPASILFGSVFGWVYVRQLGFGNPFWWQRRLYERRQRTQRLARMSADQFVAEEVDPILEKIAREGMNSLTREERRILSLASSKVAERK